MMLTAHQKVQMKLGELQIQLFEAEEELESRLERLKEMDRREFAYIDELKKLEDLMREKLRELETTEA